MNDKERQERSPMWRKHREAQAENPGALVLSRVGDFYEAFEDDAGQVSQVLDIPVIGRKVGGGPAVPMAGIVYHQLWASVDKLQRAGFAVVVVED